MERRLDQRFGCTIPELLYSLGAYQTFEFRLPTRRGVQYSTVLARKYTIVRVTSTVAWMESEADDLRSSHEDESLHWWELT